MELRKRRPTARFGDSVTLDEVLNIAERCRHIVLFTGSGISAASGMSMFSTRNGLYERARKKFKVQDGIKLFTYSFYRQRREEVQGFFAQIYSEAQASRAATGHYAMAQMLQLGALQRHYTLNIDGLSEVVGMDTWHHERNPQGSTVEMHGNIRQLVCPSCHSVEPLSRYNINLMRAQQPVPCSACGQDQLRFKVMLYDDGEGDCITPEHVFDVLEEDLKVCDMVVWAGISFQQSASVEYFRRVRHMLGTLGRLNAVPQVLINPSEEPYFNLLSAMSNPNELQLLDLRETSDVAFPAMAERLREVIVNEGAECHQEAAAPLTLNGVGHGNQDVTAAAAAAAAAAATAAAVTEPSLAATATAKVEAVQVVGSECAAPVTAWGMDLGPLSFDLGTKTQMHVLNGMKLEVDLAASNGIAPGSGVPLTTSGAAAIGTESRGGSSGGALVDLAASGTPEPEPRSARSVWRAARGAKPSLKEEDGAAAEPLFVDDADDEDYVEGEDEEEGRCRRNGRGRGRGGRSAMGRGRVRARSRRRGGGSSGGSSRAGSYGGGAALPQAQSPLGLLVGLTPDAGLPGGGSAEVSSLLPLARPGLRLGVSGLSQVQLFQPPPLPSPQQQQAIQQLQQLQQLLQLQQLTQLRQHQQQQQKQQQQQALGGLELLQRLQALQQLQSVQQLPPPPPLQPAQPLQLQPQALPTSLPHLGGQQVAAVQLLGSNIPLQQTMAPDGGQQSLGSDQQRDGQVLQEQDLQAQLQRLAALQQRVLLQQQGVRAECTDEDLQSVQPGLGDCGPAKLVSTAVSAELAPQEKSAGTLFDGLRMGCPGGGGGLAAACHGYAAPCQGVQTGVPHPGLERSAVLEPVGEGAAQGSASAASFTVAGDG